MSLCHPLCPQEIPSSPFRIKVDPSHDASKVKAEGPGISRTGERMWGCGLLWGWVLWGRDVRCCGDGWLWGTDSPWVEAELGLYGSLWVPNAQSMGRGWSWVL